MAFVADDGRVADLGKELSTEAVQDHLLLRLPGTTKFAAVLDRLFPFPSPIIGHHALPWPHSDGWGLFFVKKKTPARGASEGRLGLNALAMRCRAIQQRSHDIPVASSWRQALDLFPICSTFRPMPSERQTLVFTVRMGLRQGLMNIRGMRPELTVEQQERVAETIVEMLETHNWKISLGEPGRPPSI
jgi:hypothetical protein